MFNFITTLLFLYTSVPILSSKLAELLDDVLEIPLCVNETPALPVYNQEAENVAQYSNELLYKMVIAVLRYPENLHSGEGFWKFAKKFFGSVFFGCRDSTTLQEKWRAIHQQVCCYLKPS